MESSGYFFQYWSNVYKLAFTEAWEWIGARGIFIDILLSIGATILVYKPKNLNDVNFLFVFVVLLFALGLFGMVYCVWISKVIARNDFKLKAKLEDRYKNTSIDMKAIIFARSSPEQWVGLGVQNNELLGVTQFYLMLLSIVDEDGEEKVPIPIKLNWSAQNIPTEQYKLPREETLFFDLAATRIRENKAYIIRFGGHHVFPVWPGRYNLKFKLGGEIEGNDIKPHYYSGVLSYLGDVRLRLDDVKRITAEEAGV